MATSPAASTAPNPLNQPKRSAISRALENANSVLFVLYGGLAAFKGDRDAEADHHRGELQRAAELLTTNFPNISVEPYFVKFDGIWEIKHANRAESAPKQPSGDGTREIA